VDRRYREQPDSFLIGCDVPQQKFGCKQLFVGRRTSGNGNSGGVCTRGRIDDGERLRLEAGCE
jgi:hypothetical protein